jgi:transposase
MGNKGCSFSGTLIPSVKLAKSTSRIDMNASLNANAKLSLRGFTNCPYQAEINMSKQRNKACGADIHKNKIVATILSLSGTKNQAEFGTTLPELLRFKAWLIHNDCNVIAMESTGTYWIPVYSVLEGSMEVIVANPYMIKHIPGKKTDLIDADWLAELCLKDLIIPSRIFPKEDRALRSLTRAREGLVKIRTQFKNKIHRDIYSSHIKLSSVVTDIFGNSGMHILMGMLDDRSIDEIIQGIPSGRVKKNAGKIKESIENNLDPSQIFLIESCLDLVGNVQDKIDMIDADLKRKIRTRQNDMKIAMSIPGIEFISAATILAEIGNYRDFSSPEQLASYFGIVPFVNQSADKLHTGCITKHGSKHLRWIMVQVAHAASKKIGSKLRKFYLRVRARRGANVAIVALARKILCILHHLLINQEMYEEPGGPNKTKPVKLDQSSSQKELTAQEMIDVLRRSGYEVRKIQLGACG